MDSSIFYGNNFLQATIPQSSEISALVFTIWTLALTALYIFQIILTAFRKQKTTLLSRVMARLGLLICLLELLRCIDLHGDRGRLSFVTCGLITDNVTLCLCIAASFVLSRFLVNASTSLYRLGLLNPQLDKRRKAIRTSLIIAHIVVFLIINITSALLYYYNYMYIKSTVFWAFACNFFVIFLCLHFATDTLIETTKRYITLILHPPSAGVFSALANGSELLIAPNFYNLTSRDYIVELLTRSAVSDAIESGQDYIYGYPSQNTSSLSGSKLTDDSDSNHHLSHPHDHQSGGVPLFVTLEPMSQSAIVLPQSEPSFNTNDAMPQDIPTDSRGLPHRNSLSNAHSRHGSAAAAVSPYPPLSFSHTNARDLPGTTPVGPGGSPFIQALPGSSTFTPVGSSVVPSATSVASSSLSVSHQHGHEQSYHDVDAPTTGVHPTDGRSPTHDGVYGQGQGELDPYINHIHSDMSLDHDSDPSQVYVTRDGDNTIQHSTSIEANQLILSTSTVKSHLLPQSIQLREFNNFHHPEDQDSATPYATQSGTIISTQHASPQLTSSLLSPTHPTPSAIGYGQQTPQYNSSQTERLIKANPLYSENDMLFRNEHRSLLSPSTGGSGHSHPPSTSSSSSSTNPSVSVTYGGNGAGSGSHPHDTIAGGYDINNAHHDQIQLHRQIVASIDTLYPNQNELHLVSRLPPSLYPSYVSLRSSIRQTLFLKISTLSLVFVTVCILSFHAIANVTNKHPLEPSYQWWNDDLLSYIQLIGLAIILWVSVSKQDYTPDGIDPENDTLFSTDDDDDEDDSDDNMRAVSTVRSTRPLASFQQLFLPKQQRSGANGTKDVKFGSKGYKYKGRTTAYIPIPPTQLPSPSTGEAQLAEYSKNAPESNISTTSNTLTQRLLE